MPKCSHAMPVEMPEVAEKSAQGWKTTWVTGEGLLKRPVGKQQHLKWHYIPVLKQQHPILSFFCCAELSVDNVLLWMAILNWGLCYHIPFLWSEQPHKANTTYKYCSQIYLYWNFWSIALTCIQVNLTKDATRKLWLRLIEWLVEEAAFFIPFLSSLIWSLPIQNHNLIENPSLTITDFRLFK